MAYIGNFPAEKYTTFSKQTFTPDGSTTSFTLDFSVANENDLELFVNNVRQEPGSGKAYTATGLTLTMSSAPGASDDMYAIFQGKAQQTVTPGSQTVTGSMLATDIAISTTGNITTTGDLTVDTTTLHVDSANNRVGIGTTSPATNLDVVGTVYARSQLYTDNLRPYSGSLLTYGTGGTHYFNGNVGIGTSSPNERLSVVAEDDTSSIDNGFSIYRSVGDDKVTINTQGGAAKFIADGGSNYIPYRFFGYDGTTLAERLTIDGSGNVGIGTSSPTARLTVIEDVSRSALTGTGVGQIHISGGATPADNDVSSITFSTNNTTTTSSIIGNQITNNGSNLFFGTSNNYGSGVTNTAMFIDYAGHIGIGTSTLPRTLNIYGASNGTIGLDNIATGSPQIAFKQAGVDKAYLSYWDAFDTLSLSDGSGNGLHFKPSTGNVGIGTSSPSSKLDVNGTVTATAFSGSGLGKVLQVLQGQNATQISTTTHNTNFDITSISITPSSTSSKILILGVVMGIQGNNNSNNTRFDAKIFRGGSPLNSSGANFWTFNTNYWREGGFAIHWLDSPSTTSATTYYLKGAWLDPAGGTCYVNKDGNSGYSTLTVMEIAS